MGYNSLCIDTFLIALLHLLNPMPTILTFFFNRFVAGFFFAAIPWYIGVFILLFVIQDHREKTGLIACTIAVSIRHFKNLEHKKEKKKSYVLFSMLFAFKLH